MSEQAKTRKQLIEEYKQQKQAMGVYQIRNIASGKVYVASSLNLRAAWNAEQFKLESGLHANMVLQSDWNAQGPANFAFEVVHELKLADEVKDVRGELKALEAMAIEDIQPYDERGYNARPHKTVRS